MFLTEILYEGKGVLQKLARSYRGLAIAFVAALLVIYAFFTFSITMNSTISVSAVEASGVGIYWDRNCNNEVPSIDWGTLEPGSVKKKMFYVRDEGEEPLCLTLSTANWNPPNASRYLSLWWDAEGRWMEHGEVLQSTLTLSVSRYIEGITSFSFDILVTGSDSLLGDVDGDGKVTLLDLKKITMIFNST